MSTRLERNLWAVLFVLIALAFIVVTSGCGLTPDNRETRHLSWSDKHSIITTGGHTYEAELKHNIMTLTVDGREVTHMQKWCDIGLQHYRFLRNLTRGWEVSAMMSEDKTMHLSVDGVVVVTRVNWCVEIREYI